MKKTILIIAALTILITPALAQPKNTFDLIYELSKHHGPYNKMLADYGLGKANIIISTYRGTETYQTKTDAQGYARLYRGRQIGATVTLWTSQATIDTILNSADPKAAFDAAVKNKEIKTSGAINLKKLRVKKTIRLPPTFALNNIVPRLAPKLSSLLPSGAPRTGLAPASQAQQATQGVQQLPIFTQNAAGQPCGNMAWRPIPMGNWNGVNVQCGPGLTCFNGYCIRSGYVPQIPQAGQTGKKRPGEKCNHGGECTTTYCVKIPYSGEYGSNDPATFACSCSQWKYITTC